MPAVTPVSEPPPPEPTAPEENAAEVEVSTPTKAPANWQKWAAWGVVGAGVAVVGVGVMFGISANRAEDQARDADIFSASDQANYDARKSRGKWAPVLMGVGSAAVVGGGIWAYLLYSRSPAAPSAGLDLDLSDGIRLAYDHPF